MVRKPTPPMSEQEKLDRQLLADWAEDEGVKPGDISVFELPPATLDRLYNAALSNGYSLGLYLTNRNTAVTIMLMAGDVKIRRFAHNAAEFIEYAHELADKAEKRPRKLAP